MTLWGNTNWYKVYGLRYKVYKNQIVLAALICLLFPPYTLNLIPHNFFDYSGSLIRFMACSINN